MTEPITISNSRANCYRRCPKQFEFKYQLKLRKRLIGLPLKRGDWLHQLLMVNADGEDWKVRHRELTAKFMELLLEEREEYGDLPTECARIMRTYLKHYAVEEKHYRVVDTEIDEIIDLPNGDKFNVIIDKIVEEADGSLWIVDYKTVKSFMPEGFMLIDSQLARYFWAAHKMGYKNLRGAMFDELCTKPPTYPKLLAKGGLSKAKIWCDSYTYLEAVKANELSIAEYKPFILKLHKEHDRFFRRTRLPRDAPMVKRLMRELVDTADEIKEAIDTQRFPRTARKECLHDCDYLSPCTIELQGGDIQDVIDLQYEISKRESEAQIQWPSK